MIKNRTMILLLLLLFTSIGFSQSIVINEVMSANQSTLKDTDGDYSDWIELYNNTASAVNLNGYGLSDELSNNFKWIIPDVTIQSNSYLLIFASGKNRNLAGSELHTNFKLNSSGIPVQLVNASGIIIDQAVIDSLPPDISYGRKPDANSSFYYFDSSTPNLTNNNSATFTGITKAPVFSVEGGYYSGTVSLNLSTATPGSLIYYTIDGSEPTTSSTFYFGPITVDSVRVISAKAFAPNFVPSKTIIKTYLINVEKTLPVISMSTDPSNLWDSATGIYVEANINKDWDRPVHIDFFEPTGQLGFSVNAEIKLFGGVTRTYPQKPIAIYMKSKYGDDKINYQIFPNNSVKTFNSLVLRNSGQDWYSSMFRDALMQNIADVDSKLDVQDYRPAILFLNGKYWGIHNIREKIDEDFINAHHSNVDKDSLDILKDDGTVVNGNSAHYTNMLNYIQNNIMSIQSNYDYIKTQMDVDNFIDYVVSQIYIANTDWPGANIEYWRPQTVDGKWRWILFDTDFGFGLTTPIAYTHNTLDFATATGGPAWPNPDWSTFLLRNLLLNTEFKNDFINRFAEYSNTKFKSDIVVQKINVMESSISNEMHRHLDRWQNQSYAAWTANVDSLKYFAQQRIGYLRNYFVQKFGLTGTSNVTFNVNPSTGGKIKIVKDKPDIYPWTGVYFNDVPIKIETDATPGYHFVGWQGVSSDSNSAIFTLNGNVSITAIFEPDTGGTNTVLINEINYHSSSIFNPKDWIEIYNRTNAAVDISNWIFMDSDTLHKFVFPSGTILQSGSYLILSEDSVTFKSKFPGITNIIGNFSFGLNNGGETIQLYDTQQNLIDAVHYNDKAPWPTGADGTGQTLSLINPDLNNSIPDSWSVSKDNGSPGSVNSIVTGIEDNKPKTTPRDYSLKQNYPNPFNPSTTIEYSIPNSGIVSLKIYNILGKEIASLVNEEKSAGNYKVNFNASGLSSGVYFYRIRVNAVGDNNNYVATKKFILMK